MKEIIEKLLHEPITSLVPIEVGLSNDHFIVNHHAFVRVPKKDGRKDQYPRIEKQIEEEVASQFHPSFPILAFDEVKNIKITPYRIDFTCFSKENYTSSQIKQIAELLYSLHHYPTPSISFFFDPLKRIEIYYKESQKEKHPLHEEIIKRTLPYYASFSPCLCHHDLVEGNLLFIHQHVELIDFEYAGLDDPFFDLASFISENEIFDSSSLSLFLNTYFHREIQKEEKEKLSTFLRLNDLLWYYWAHMMYAKTQKEIYLEIAKEKEEHLSSPLSL